MNWMWRSQQLHPTSNSEETSCLIRRWSAAQSLRSGTCCSANNLILTLPSCLWINTSPLNVLPRYTHFRHFLLRVPVSPSLSFSVVHFLEAWKKDKLVKRAEPSEKNYGPPAGSWRDVSSALFTSCWPCLELWAIRSTFKTNAVTTQAVVAQKSRSAGFDEPLRTI